jgi:hypothetical protein
MRRFAHISVVNVPGANISTDIRNFSGGNDDSDSDDDEESDGEDKSTSVDLSSAYNVLAAKLPKIIDIRQFCLTGDILKMMLEKKV